MRRATIAFVVAALFAGCQDTYQYKYTPDKDPRYVLSYKYSDLALRVSYGRMKPSDLDFKLLDFQLGLHESYDHVNASFDVAARNTNRLKELKAEHFSMQQKWLGFQEELSSIRRQNAELQIGLTLWDPNGPQETIDGALEHLGQIEQRIVQLEEQVAIYNDRYAVDRQRHILNKNKYREHLLKGLTEIGIPEAHIYSDDRVIVYVDSLRVTTESVTLTLKAYIADPCLPVTDSGLHPWPGRSFHAPPESLIFAYNTRGDSMGSPSDVTRVAHPEVKGVTLRLTYQDATEGLEGHVKFILGSSVLSNKERVTFSIPYSLQEVAPPALPSNIAPSPPLKTVKDFVDEIKTISCRRDGGHLVVPVSLNIHGKSVDAGMILDTGASITTVPLTLYRKGTPKTLSDLSQETFLTANGTIQCYVDAVQVSTSAYSKTLLIAISDHETALLGANYFQGNVFTVDVDNECIYVHPRAQ